MIELEHRYFVSRNGTYLGTLPNVVSKFEYKQEINQGATRITIEVGKTLDTSDEPVVPLETEDGLTITTEDLQTITTDRAPEIIGTKDSGMLIANGNDIDVYEYSERYPNGKLVFAGYQSKMRGRLGGEESIYLTVLNKSKDLNEYIYGNDDFTLQSSQLITGDDFGIWAARRAGQTFTTEASQTTVSKITLRLLTVGAGQTRTVTMKLWNSAAQALPLGATPLSSVAIVLSNTSYAEYDFIFPSEITVSTSTQYFFTIEVDAASIFGDSNTWLGFDAGAASPYAGGSGKRSDSGAAWVEFSTDTDFYFKIYSGSLLTDAVFAATKPSSMITTALDAYQAQGGIVTYTGASIDTTDDPVNYTFRLATVLELIQKARELAPADFYWYVDVATQVLYFLPTATTATHQFNLGRHINQFTFESSIEQIKNVVYFTGGPTGGINLLKLYTDDDSLAINRRGMERLYDDRILAADEPSARALSESFMEESSREEFRLDPLTILGNDYDITTINVGDTCAVAGTQSFLDTIVFQITRVERESDRVTLILGKLRLRSSSLVGDIKNKLQNSLTLDNPSLPS